MSINERQYQNKIKSSSSTNESIYQIRQCFRKNIHHHDNEQCSNLKVQRKNTNKEQSKHGPVQNYR